MTTATTFAWLEITGKCQLECTHCYADSGPTGSHGQMRRQDWERVIDELAEAGVTMVQFIGGEPMLHPDLGALIDRATTRGLQVEVYSNLVHVPASIWPLLERPGGLARHQLLQRRPSRTQCRHRAQQPCTHSRQHRRSDPSRHRGSRRGHRHERRPAHRQCSGRVGNARRRQHSGRPEPWSWTRSHPGLFATMWKLRVGQSSRVAQRRGLAMRVLSMATDR